MVTQEAIAPQQLKSPYPDLFEYLPVVNDATAFLMERAHRLTGPQSYGGVILAFAEVEWQPDDLSPAEHWHLGMAAMGYTTGEAADITCISEQTVKSHWRGILTKFDVHSRSHAMRVAYEEGKLPVLGTGPQLKSERQLEVLQAISLGLTNPDIGEQLHIEEETVKSHVRHILEGLGAANRVHAVSLGFQSGQLQPREQLLRGDFNVA